MLYKNKVEFISFDKTSTNRDDGAMVKEAIIARTGIQQYSLEEIIEGTNGKIKTLDGYEETYGNLKLTDLVDVIRDRKTLEDGMESFNDRSITNDHIDIDDCDISEDSCGHISNARIVDDGDESYIAAKIIITDAKLQEDIIRGKRQVSCGYKTMLEINEINGKIILRQTDLTGNHVAVVNEARGGVECSILDKKVNTMNEDEKKAFDELVEQVKLLTEKVEELSKEEVETDMEDAKDEHKEDPKEEKVEAEHKDEDEEKKKVESSHKDARISELELVNSKQKYGIKTAKDMSDLHTKVIANLGDSGAMINKDLIGSVAIEPYLDAGLKLKNKTKSTEWNVTDAKTSTHISAEDKQLNKFLKG